MPRVELHYGANPHGIKPIGPRIAGKGKVEVAQEWAPVWFCMADGKYRKCYLKACRPEITVDGEPYCYWELFD